VSLFPAGRDCSFGKIKKKKKKKKFFRKGNLRKNHCITLLQDIIPFQRPKICHAFPHQAAALPRRLNTFGLRTKSGA
jgi:hypothetical protein